jgi:hypothetical protein
MITTTTKAKAEAEAVSLPERFMRRTRGLEFCLVDEQGFFSDFASMDDGWLRALSCQ